MISKSCDCRIVFRILQAAFLPTHRGIHVCCLICNLTLHIKQHLYYYYDYLYYYYYYYYYHYYNTAAYDRDIPFNSLIILKGLGEFRLRIRLGAPLRLASFLWRVGCGVELVN